MEREPNTQYVLSLSYGKDSIATIEACKRLGYPIDRIIHAEVWATDDISADLPPMVEFKAKADAIIKERYGLEVEHVCAMAKDGTKQTYEKMFYHVPKRRPKNTEYVGIVNGYPQTVGGASWCKKLKVNTIAERERERESGSLKELWSDSQQSRSNAQALSRRTFSQEMPTGFPVIGVPWCNKSLKVDSLRFSQRIPSGKEKGKPNNMVCRSQTNSLFRFAP